MNQFNKIVAKSVTLHDVSATSVGLGNVDNTSDINKPISTAAQAALDLKANQSTTYTKTEVDTNIANLVDTAPATLDTLNELAAALGDDANFAATTASALGEKLAKASNLSDLANAATARTNLGLLSAATTESTDYATAAQGAKADIAEAFTSNVTAFGNNLVDDVNAAAARTTLELGNVTNESKATMFTNPSFTGDLTVSGNFTLATIDDVADSIATNTADIATNTADISTNTGNIATNTADISTNTADIATNVTNIATNTADISTNTGNIATNVTNISTNVTDISTNTADIATNTGNIATNVTNISTNTADIATNTGNIATNVTNIATNTSDIADLEDSTESIATVVTGLLPTGTGDNTAKIKQ